MTMEFGALILLIIAIVYVALSIRIAKEGERFAVFILGRFAGLKGPGLVLTIPGAGHYLHRIALGAEGQIQSNELVSIGTHAIPFVSGTSARSGTKVRVSGFESNRIKVEPLQAFVVCEKCGHKNAI